MKKPKEKMNAVEKIVYQYKELSNMSVKELQQRKKRGYMGDGIDHDGEKWVARELLRKAILIKEKEIGDNVFSANHLVWSRKLINEITTLREDTPLTEAKKKQLKNRGYDPDKEKKK